MSELVRPKIVVEVVRKKETKAQKRRRLRGEGGKPGTIIWRSGKTAGPKTPTERLLHHHLRSIKVTNATSVMGVGGRKNRRRQRSREAELQPWLRRWAAIQLGRDQTLNRLRLEKVARKRYEGQDLVDDRFRRAFLLLPPSAQQRVKEMGQAPARS